MFKRISLKNLNFVPFELRQAFDSSIFLTNTFKRHFKTKTPYRGNKKHSKPENYSYKIEEFNPQGSKYSMSHVKSNSLNPNTESSNKEVPRYLENDDRIQDRNEEGETRGISLKGLKSGKRMKIIPKQIQKKMTKDERRENTKNLRLEAAKKERERLKLPMEERKLLENDEKAATRYDPGYVVESRNKLLAELAQIKKERRQQRTNTFNTESLIDFMKEERLSKRLARLGITSRKQAEKMIETGMVKIDGKTVKENVPVTDETNIQIYSANGYKTPIPESTKIWLFYKPVGFVCTNNDEKGRVSIHKYLQANKFPLKHFIIVVYKFLILGQVRRSFRRVSNPDQ
jgi:hypothetical protein